MTLSAWTAANHRRGSDSKMVRKMIIKPKLFPLESNHFFPELDCNHKTAIFTMAHNYSRVCSFFLCFCCFLCCLSLKQRLLFSALPFPSEIQWGILYIPISTLFTWSHIWGHLADVNAMSNIDFKVSFLAPPGAIPAFIPDKRLIILESLRPFLSHWWVFRHSVMPPLMSEGGRSCRRQHQRHLLILTEFCAGLAVWGPNYQCDTWPQLTPVQRWDHVQVEQAWGCPDHTVWIEEVFPHLITNN